ncbi:unnamed protein product [Arabidopsis halleri]
MGSGVSRALIYGFVVGDLVWAFASPSVCHMRRIDLVIVAFFGDSNYGPYEIATDYFEEFFERCGRSYG